MEAAMAHLFAAILTGSEKRISPGLTVQKIIDPFITHIERWLGEQQP